MTEDEYIITGDLKSITHALTIMRDVVSENNELIDDGDYTLVTGILRKWQIWHHEKLSAEDK